MRFARGVNRNVTNEKIFADADNIDALNVAARLADRRRDLAELPGLVLDLDAKRKTVTGVRCWFVSHFLSVAHP